MAKVFLRVCVIFLVLLQALLQSHAAAPFAEQRPNEGDRWKNTGEIQEGREVQEEAEKTDLAGQSASEKDQWVDRGLTNKQRETQEGYAVNEPDTFIDPQLSEEVRNSFPDQWNAEDELYQSEANQDQRDVKSKTGAQEEEDLKTLKSTVSELKTAVATMSQQIDALLRQDSETLKLLNAKSSKVEQRNLNDKREVDRRGVQVMTTGGVSYIRWGRTVCPDSRGTQPLYKGFAATAHHSHLGGGANFLCLHEQPQRGVNFKGFQGGSIIYGVQYILDEARGSPFSTANNRKLSLRYNDAPCVLCHSAIRSNKVMIPARRSCPVGWTVEYRGYLASAYHNALGHQKTSYICLDEIPEAVPGGEKSTNGARLYPVQAGCGSLPCPKYANGDEIACVVCSK